MKIHEYMLQKRVIETSYRNNYRSNIQRYFITLRLRETENNFIHPVNFMVTVKFFSLFQTQSAHIQCRLETRRRNTVPACSTILTADGHESPPF